MRGRGVQRAPLIAAVVAALAALWAVAVQPPARAWAQAAALTGDPVRLVVPAMSVDAPVAPFALNEDFSMPVPQVASLVAWYTYSAAAGADGNVVLAGHRDWQRQKGVFYDLGVLQPDDQVWLQDAAATWYLYTVLWNVSLEDDRAPVEEIAGPTDTPSITMITCSGVFDRAAGRYVERRIVRAQLTAVVPAEPPAPQ